ncbi:hypothetical protein QYF36_003892 [Acer negundo]|nr:hypothetical protein QYF36_003892 [Acer negundo]
MGGSLVIVNCETQHYEGPPHLKKRCRFGTREGYVQLEEEADPISLSYYQAMQDKIAIDVMEDLNMCSWKNSEVLECIVDKITAIAQIVDEYDCERVAQKKNKKIVEDGLKDLRPNTVEIKKELGL